MDNSLTLARHYARLVWLLMHEGPAKDDQKVALRAVVTVSKEASVRLGINEGRLAVNGLVMPQALTGVHELAEQLVGHAIDEIEIEQGASPGELLALARLLALESASNSDAAEFAKKLALLVERTVHVRLAEATDPKLRAAARAASAASAALEPPLTTGSERVRKLFGQLAGTTDDSVASGLLEEIAFVAEQATREGRIADAANVFTALIEREGRLPEGGIRRAYAMALRRLTKPTLLRPIAEEFATDPTCGAQVELIIQRCAQDGVDAVVGCYAAAPTAEARRRYHDLLLRLPGATESLVEMLRDPRWHVVRLAAEFLGELGSPEAERPLAELLRHQDGRVRRAVTRALGRIESTFTTDALARSAIDDVPAVRLEAVAALSARRGGPACSILAGAIDDEAEPEVQYALLAALGRVGTAEAVQKLAKAAEAAGGFFKTKKNVGLRVAAIHALGEARTPGALTALQGLANDKVREVRDAVVRTIHSSHRPSSAA
jgi:HEAT repeat protein